MREETEQRENGNATMRIHKICPKCRRKMVYRHCYGYHDWWCGCGHSEPLLPAKETDELLRLLWLEANDLEDEAI